MNFDVESRTILLVKHGSHAYNLATETSDLDVKGISVPPLKYHLGFSSVFEQHIRETSKGHPTDLVIYSLRKFAKLASESNPNIIEVLFGDDSDIIKIDEFGEELRAFRQNFLSKKARFTFSGYAFSQLKRIITHRNWLLNPPKEPPTRKEYGLSDTFQVSKTELGAFNTLLEKGSFQELSNEALSLYSKERAYKNMLTQWNQYQEWRSSRNPARAELEAKFGYDSKHASHLIRLMRMCKEILLTGQVIVKRPDREYLLNVKRGQRSYDEIIEESEKLESDINDLYESSNVLPKHPNINLIDNFIVDLTQRYLSKHG